MNWGEIALGSLLGYLGIIVGFVDAMGGVGEVRRAYALVRRQDRELPGWVCAKCSGTGRPHGAVCPACAGTPAPNRRGT